MAVSIGVSPVLVSQWSTGPRVPPIERCVPIERATGGAVTRKDLRPDDWQKIWPELAQAPASETSQPSARTHPAQHPDPSRPRILNQDWPLPEEKGVTHV